MRKADIKVGSCYNVVIDGVPVVVQIKSSYPIDPNGRKATGYDCTIQKTDSTPSKMVGRKVTLESAAKFRSEYVKPQHPLVGEATLSKETQELNEHMKKTVTVSEADPLESKTCLGYSPSLVSGRCRCAVCKTKPMSERTQRPFVSASAADPGSSPSTVPTSSSAVSSPQKPPPKAVTRADSVIETAGGVMVMEHKTKSVFANVPSQEIVTDGSPHLVIEARAGTGKTTTLVEGLKVMLGFGSHLTPSPQQQAVWDALCLSQGKARTVCFVAFNKSIAGELKRRVPPSVDAMTMHSMGFKAIGRAFRLWGGDRSVNDWRVSNIIEELSKTDIQELRRRKGGMVRAVTELVGLCKVNLLGMDGGRFSAESIDSDELDQLVSYFDIDLDGTTRDEVYPLVVRVLQRCLDVGQDRCIDYNDMIWLPVVLNLPMQRYDMLLVDEAQDLNRCQQALAKMAGERLILCGDPKQAIYGFAGADCESMERMFQELKATDREAQLLPLTVTRRCGHAIVKEANKIVQDFSAHETNPTGIVYRDSLDEKATTDYRKRCNDGDMVLCRVNGPLVSECFRFIKAGRKANIQGRDIGKGLQKTIEKMKATTVEELVVKLEAWANSEVEKESKKKFPSEAKIIGINDKLDCILAFIEGVDAKGSPALVVQKIDAVFTDNKDAPGIKLSSIHKAKGLEAERVFLLEPEGGTVPHPMAKTPWQMEQEWNLRYVAVTRAIKELVFVS